MTATNAMSPEEMFDSIGPAYEQAFAGLRPQLDSIQWVLAQIQGRRPAKVLDIGCGTGRPVCSAFADAGHNVLGIDVSGVMLEDARKKVANAEFMKADVFQVELQPSTYDAITVYFSLIAGTSQDLIRLQMRRIYGWLREGGVFVLATVPNSADRVSGSFMGREFVGSGLSPEEYVACLKNVGFDIVYTDESSFKPRAVDATGVCREEEADEEPHLFIYARKEKEDSVDQE